MNINTDNNTPVSAHTHSPTTPSGNQAGEKIAEGVSVVPQEEVQKFLQDLPSELLVKITNYLPLNDLLAYTRTCRRVDEAISDHGVIGKAWFRRFSPQQQACFSKIAEGVSEEDIRAWVSQFSKEDGAVDNLLAQRQSINFTPILFCTVSRLMADCRTFNVEKIATITHDGGVISATFSDDGRHVVTASCDKTAKIYGRGEDGNWTEKATITHDGWVISATFSADGRHVVTASDDKTAKIYGRGEDGNWTEKATITHDSGVISATFSADGRHVVTASDDKTAKIYGRGEDGNWTEKATITHDGGVNSATFSADGRHVVTASDDKTAKIYGRGEDGNWTEKATITHDGWVNSATFSADGRHVVTASDDKTAKIYGRGEDGNWTEKATITHDGWVNSATFSADGRHVVTAS